MVRLTCLLRRKDGLTPAEFHAHWSEVHGPLIARSQSGRFVVRYEQHPRPLDDYRGEDDPGFDGVTVQWFESMDDYRAHMAEPDFPEIWADIDRFLVDSWASVDSVAVGRGTARSVPRTGERAASASLRRRAMNSEKSRQSRPLIRLTCRGRPRRRRST
jgi:uncharacterized protein (TIGR02118 family)